MSVSMTVAWVFELFGQIVSVGREVSFIDGLVTYSDIVGHWKS